MSKKHKKKSSRKSVRKSFPWFRAAVLFGLLVVIFLAVAILSKPTPVARAVSMTPHIASVQTPIPIATPSAPSTPIPTLAPVATSAVQAVAGKSGAAGKNGTPGAVGASGPAGKDGVNGSAGIGIKSIACNPDGTWAVALTDGTTQAITGPCIGTNGHDGAQGAPGSAPVGWTYRDAYGFRYTCVRASYYTDQSPQYTCTQG